MTQPGGRGKTNEKEIGLKLMGSKKTQVVRYGLQGTGVIARNDCKKVSQTKRGIHKVVG